MKGLLIKDFKQMKNQMRFLFVILFFSIMFGVLYENAFFAMGYASSCVAIAAISSISYDEFDNGLPFLFTLPFERKMYVKEKYVFSGIMIVCTIGVAAVISFVTSVVKDWSYSTEEWITVVALSFAVSLLMLSCILPVQLKYGSEKGRIAMIVVIFVVLAIIYAIGKVTEMAGINLEAAINEVMESPVKLAGAVAVGVAIALAASIKISTGIMEKKDF